MELIHVRRTGAELIESASPIELNGSEVESDLPLVSGQNVVIVDLDGEFHGASVVEPRGSGYAITIGARLPPDLAAERLADVDLLPDHRATHVLVDLLGDLRAQWRAGSD